MAPDEEHDLPEGVPEALEECTEEQLRAVIRHAQRLLMESRGRTSGIRPRNVSEEIVSTEDKDAYTLVVLRVDWSDDLQAYHVSSEPDLDGGEDHYRWRYVGPIES